MAEKEQEIQGPLFKPLLMPPRAIRRLEAIGETNDPVADILWAYNHLYDEDPAPESDGKRRAPLLSMICPCRGAWNMLMTARSKSPEWFIQHVYRPICGEMAKKKADNQEAESLTKRERQSRESIDKMIAEAVELCAPSK